MNIINKLDEAMDFMMINPSFEIKSDEKIFAEMANFLISIEPDQLTDDQLQKMVEIFTNMESEADQIEEEIKAGKETKTKKMYAASYYRGKKQTIKKKKVELKRSLKGKTRERMEPIMLRGRKTPTGRHKVTYNN